jgi:hypothetical protein
MATRPPTATITSNARIRGRRVALTLTGAKIAPPSVDSGRGWSSSIVIDLGPPAYVTAGR